MSNQEYCAGHRVRVLAASRSGPPTAGDFVIKGCHSVEGGEFMYSLRSLRGRRQRMTPESELTPSGAREIAA